MLNFEKNRLVSIKDFPPKISVDDLRLKFNSIFGQCTESFTQI